VKGRESLIESSWEEELYKYISGIVRNKGQKMLAIGGIPNHIHFLIGMNPSCSISDLVREIKKSSNQFIKETLDSILLLNFNILVSFSKP
jgi:REP element-mobilizing transposase RayT